MASIRIYVKRQIRLDRLNFSQRQMFTLGNVALAARKNDIAALRTPNGERVKPLTRPYAIFKTRRGKGNRRNLQFTGDMIRNWSVRTVSENRATASWTTLRDRIKALSNNRIQSFVGHSQDGRKAVVRAGQRLLSEALPRMVLGRQLGIRT